MSKRPLSTGKLRPAVDVRQAERSVRCLERFIRESARVAIGAYPELDSMLDADFFDRPSPDLLPVERVELLARRYRKLAGCLSALQHAEGELWPDVMVTTLGYGRDTDGEVAP